MSWNRSGISEKPYVRLYETTSQKWDCQKESLVSTSPLQNLHCRVGASEYDCCAGILPKTSSIVYGQDLTREVVRAAELRSYWGRFSGAGLGSVLIQAHNVCCRSPP